MTNQSETIEEETQDHDDGSGLGEMIGVHAHQVQQEDTKANLDEEDDIDDTDDIFVSYYERSFPVGSIFSFPVQAASPAVLSLKQSEIEDDNDGEEEDWGVSVNPATFHISKDAKLSIRTASIDGSASMNGTSVSLYLSTDTNPDYLCLCPNLSQKNNSVVTPIDLEICGPSTVQMALVSHVHNSEGENECNDFSHYQESLGSVNVFGSVSLLDPVIGKAMEEAKKNIPIMIVEEESDKNEMDIDPDETLEKIDIENKVKESGTKQKEAAKNKAKKRKLSDSDKETAPKEGEGEGEGESGMTKNVEKLTRKQRKKLAKIKAKELEEVIAKENGHSLPSSEQTNNTQKTKQKSTSLTKARTLPGGIKIQDILRGTGPVVKSGRKVAITYKGTFPDTDKVFDKNLSTNHPLVFRLGTGEVIKGLEQGLDGMKAGGNRVITIPPELAYGRKGSPPKIPKNATLTFTVTLLSVGGKS